MSPARRNSFVVACTDFLRAEALRRLSALVATKSATLGVTARRIAVKDTRSRWGSCAADGSLAFSWRLVMTPEFVQDYVAAHEVAHLQAHEPRQAFLASGRSTDAARGHRDPLAARRRLPAAARRLTALTVREFPAR